MGLFQLFKQKPKEMDEHVRRALEVFPGGQKQMQAELSEFHTLLQGAFSEEEKRFLLGAAKTLLYRAKDKRFIRCKNYIITRSGGKLSDTQVRKVYEFLCSKLSLSPDFNATEQEEREATLSLLAQQMGEMRGDGVLADAIPKGHGPFGLCKTNPVPTSGIDGSEAYLGRLRTTDRQRRLEYRRLGSTTAPDVTSGAIDIYSVSIDGKRLTDIYICPYHKRNSDRAPEGFTLD